MDLNKLKNAVDKANDEKTAKELAEQTRRKNIENKASEYKNKILNKDEETKDKLVETYFNKIDNLDDDTLQNLLEEFFTTDLALQNEDNIILKFTYELNTYFEASCEVKPDYDTYKRRQSQPDMKEFKNMTYREFAEMCNGDRGTYFNYITFYVLRNHTGSLTLNNEKIVDLSKQYKIEDNDEDELHFTLIIYDLNKGAEFEDESSKLIFNSIAESFSELTNEEIKITGAYCKDYFCKDNFEIRVAPHVIIDHVAARLEKFGLIVINDKLDEQLKTFYIQCKNPLKR